MAKRKPPAPKPCPDCVADSVTTARPIKGKGRCATHLRVHNKALSTKAHDARISRVYGVARGFYERLFLFQGGRCAICQRSTGASKRLAMDHNHALEGAESARGLLCSVCNRILGWARDDPEMLKRAANYLVDPPAVRLMLSEDGSDVA